MAGLATKTAVKSALINKILLDADTKIINTQVKEQLDWVGEFCNDLKAQWNAVNVGDLITVADYDPADYK